MHLYQLIHWAFVTLSISFVKFDFEPSLEFLISLVGIFLIAEKLKEATEDLSVHLGEQFGGILLGLMGNLPEIVISLFALSKGLTPIVKASLTGSIIGNLLVGLGCAILAGSSKFKIVKFNIRAVRIHSSMVMLATCGLLIPAIFQLTSRKAVNSISISISWVLLMIYLLSLIFNLVTHKGLYNSPEGSESQLPLENTESDEQERPRVSIGSAIGRLVFNALLIAVVSEVLTGSLEPLSKQFGFSEVFTGVILLSLGGNIGEYLNAISFARKGKMDIAIQATMGSATQVALLVAPVLVLLSGILGDRMDLNFTSYEVASVLMAVSITRAFTYDGESHWFEGVMILSVYVILGFGFYYISV